MKLFDFFTETTSGKAFFKYLDKPKLRDALRLTIFVIPLNYYVFNLTKVKQLVKNKI